MMYDWLTWYLTQWSNCHEAVYNAVDKIEIVQNDPWRTMHFGQSKPET